MMGETARSNLRPWADILPSDWRKCRIDSVADVVFSNVDKHTHDHEVPVRLCNYVDVYRNDKITSCIDFMEATADQRERQRFQLQCGDVLITKDSETPDDIAIPALVAEDLTGVLCGYHLAMIRPRSERICGDYLACLHRSKQFRAQYEAIAVGVTRFGLPQYAFRAAFIPLPPISEQKLISAYLDKSCAALDTAVTIKRRQLEILESLRRSTIQRVVTHGLDEQVPLRPTGSIWIESIPAGWKLISLKRVSTVRTGLTLGKVYDGPLTERPYLRVANVQDGHLDLEQVTTIEVPAEIPGRVELRAGDVLMTEGGDLDKLGRGTLWSGEIEGCLHQNHIFAVRCFTHQLLPGFLAYLTTSPHGRDYFEATGKRTTNLATTNATKLGAFPIPLPPLAEQERLVAFLDERLDQLARLQRQLTDQIAILLAYRKSLIHECVTGQRRVTEADVARVQREKLTGAALP